MKITSLAIAAGLLVACAATPSYAQLEGLNPTGADGDPLHAFSPPPPPPPLPDYVPVRHHRHHRR